MKTKKNIYDLHEDHKTWLSSLNFYKDDIVLMQKWIEEIAKKNNSKKVLSSVEHFQNQLVIQKEQLDILTHDIRESESTLEKAVNKNPTAIDHQRFPDQPVLAERMKTYDEMFKDLRAEMANFLSKWM